MPIRQGGTLASRASTWPRDHFLPQHDGAARIVAHDVERVLADIDADHGDRGIGCLRHGALLVFGAPCPASLAGGAGARPDHPINRLQPFGSSARRILSEMMHSTWGAWKE